MIETDVEKLRVLCENIDTKRDGEKMRQVILALKEEMREKGINALAAPQIGENLRIFCVKDKDGLHSFINPMIKKSSEMTFSRENDISFPGKQFVYPRSSKIILNYQTPLGDIKSTTVVGLSAFIMQRMVDYLNAVLISDIGLEIDEQWDKATEEERAEVLKEYAQSLDLLNKKLDEDIGKDEELSKQKKAIEFEHALVSGEITLEQRETTEKERKVIKNKLKKVKETNKNEK